METMETLDKEITAQFLDYSCRRLEMMIADLGACLARLTDAQVWERHAEHENAVGNLVLHLCGNARQWVIAGIGGSVDIRARDEEFSADGGWTAQQLVELFTQTMNESRRIIAAVPVERLVERIKPQNHEVSVLAAIYQVVGHVQLHVGQIVLLTKQMTGTDLNLSTPRKIAQPR